MEFGVLLIVLIVIVLPVVVLIAVTAARGRREQAGGHLGAPPADPAELQEHLRELCARGRKIEAIKVLRERTPGLGLKQAKDAVEALEAGRPLTGALTAAGHRPPPVHAVPPDLQEHLRELCLRGNKIEAIKVLREHTPGLGLRQAKDIVETLTLGPALYPQARQAIRRPTAHDLADRVRELKAQGRIEQAVHLVRGETGMGHAEASSFVEAIQQSDAV